MASRLSLMRLAADDLNMAIRRLGRLALYHTKKAKDLWELKGIRDRLTEEIKKCEQADSPQKRGQ